jgi:hypothetical protein
MRQSFVIIFLLVGQFSFSQVRQDTIISKKTLDSLLQKLVDYKDIAKRNFFGKIIAENTMSVDSMFSKQRDTLTILNVSWRKIPLRSQEFHYDKSGCKTLLIDTYFDTTGRKLYKEQWHLGCNWENNISGFLQYRYRYHYDSSGNEVGMTAESYDGAGHRVQRFYYTIDTNGKKVWGNRVKLNEYAFWD